MKKSAPSGRELESALLKLLRKNDFRGAEDVSVFVVGPKPTPVYILTLADDVAKILDDLLVSVVGKRTSPTEFVLFRTDVEAILKAASE